MSDETTDKSTLHRPQIEKFLETHEFIMNAEVWVLCNVSTVNRILAAHAANCKLTKSRRNGHWAYKSNRPYT